MKNVLRILCLSLCLLSGCNIFPGDYSRLINPARAQSLPSLFSGRTGGLSSGGSGGGVTSVGVSGANGIGVASSPVTTSGTIALSLGNITPTTVNGLTFTSASVGYTIAGGATSKTLTVSNTATVSGTNTGDQTSVSGNAGTATALATARAIYGNNFDGTAGLTQVIASTYGGTGSAYFNVLGPTANRNYTFPDADKTILYSGGALGTPSGGVATNLTGTAAGLTAGTVTTNANLTGDVTSSGNATTLATVNSNTGSFGSTTAIPNITVNGKGLITAVSTSVVVAPAGTLTGATLASGVTASSLTSFGTSTTVLANIGASNASVAPNAQTGTTYTFVLGDALGASGTGGAVTLSNASAITATIPPHSSVAYILGAQIMFCQLGAGQVTVSPGSGVTINTSAATKKLRAQYSCATAWEYIQDSWMLFGDLAAS
jgi:hypothetical protein